MAETPKFDDKTFGQMVTVLKTLEITLGQNEGVLIHSHAGIKRPAVVVCCWIVYSKKLDAKGAVDIFAKKRLQGNAKSIKAQTQFIVKFQAGNLALLQPWQKQSRSLLRILRLV